MTPRTGRQPEDTSCVFARDVSNFDRTARLGAATLASAASRLPFAPPETARGAQEGRYANDLLPKPAWRRSEEHTSELQSLRHLVCRLLLEKKKKKKNIIHDK